MSRMDARCLARLGSRGFPVLGGRGRERVVCARDGFVARGEDVGGGHSARGLHVFAIDLRLDHAGISSGSSASSSEAEDMPVFRP